MELGRKGTPRDHRDLAAAVVDASEDGYLVLDAEGTVLFASPGCEILAGMPATELVGRSVIELVDPEWVEDVAIDIAATLSGDDLSGRIAASAFHRADGTVVVAEVILHRPEDPADGALFVHVHPAPGARLMDEFLAAMVDARELDDLLRPVMALAIADAPAHGCTVHWNWDGEAAFADHVAMGVDPSLLADGRFGTGDLPWCRAASRADPIVVPALGVADGQFASEASGRGFGALWSLPVPGHDDDRAVLTIWRTREGPPTSSSRLSVTRTLHMAALAFERHRTEAKLRHAALHDPLTGAPNRLLLDTRLDAMVHEPGRVEALLVVDLDGFKAVNDHFGHPAGDRVLRGVVQRIEQILRPGDLLARVGGDEFAVVCAGVADPEEAAIIARRLLAAIAEPLDIDGTPVRVGATIGIGLSTAGQSGDVLVRAADQALIAAKRRGKGSFQVADRSLP